MTTLLQEHAAWPIHYGLTHARQERVYFILVGQHVKIGYTGNLKQRLRHHERYGVGGQVLGSIPGGRETENYLHRAAYRSTNGMGRYELFLLNPELEALILSALKGAPMLGQALPASGLFQTQDSRDHA